MKTIMFAQLKSTNTTYTDGTIAEYQWVEKDEAEGGREWNGDVDGYVDNYIDIARDVSGIELHIVDDGITIHNEPAGAVVLADEDGFPCEMFWADDVEDNE